MFAYLTEIETNFQPTNAYSFLEHNFYFSWKRVNAGNWLSFFIYQKHIVDIFCMQSSRRIHFPISISTEQENDKRTHTQTPTPRNTTLHTCAELMAPEPWHRREPVINNYLRDKNSVFVKTSGDVWWIRVLIPRRFLRTMQGSARRGHTPFR